MIIDFHSFAVLVSQAFTLYLNVMLHYESTIKVY